MNHRTLAAAAIAAVPVVASVACAPSWVVRAQSTPDPFLNRRDFALVPIAFAGLHVGAKTEEEYLAGKTPDEQRAFYASKTTLNDAYTRSLRASAAESGVHIVTGTARQTPPFLIQPTVTDLDLGAGESWPSEVKMVVRLSAIDGTVLDTIELANRSRVGTGGARIHNDGLELGKTMASYLKTRVGPLVATAPAPSRDAGVEGVAPPAPASPGSIACWQYLVVTGTGFNGFVPPEYPSATPQDLAAYGASFPRLLPLVKAAGTSTALTATGAQLGALAFLPMNRFVSLPSGPTGQPEDVMEILIPPKTSAVGFRFTLSAPAWTGPSAANPDSAGGLNPDAFPAPVRDLMAGACAQGQAAPVVVLDEMDPAAILFP
jgi:hypothetical protein